ncbi:hypothetical protein EAF00_010368 [Botryotinia globosa]|nr:hypothetical protein EAF00_010368 [Botryotinia globosa]
MEKLVPSRLSTRSNPKTQINTVPGISNCFIRQSLPSSWTDLLAQQLSRHKIMHVESTEAPACFVQHEHRICPGPSDTEHRL